MKHLRLLILACAGLPAGCGSEAPVVPGAQAPAAESATFAGREACARCHEKESGLWRGSDHDLAMQPADATTVLGNFDGARFAYHGVVSTFYRKEAKYFARTDGPDGKLHDYEIAYTFGVRPLQQYLIAFPGGRYQALNVCWDTRPAKEGGQRWFHLYPQENVSHEDIFHWTGPYQNWNFMCAECHSTNVKKGYDAKQDSYRTTFSEIDVSCEACHGPGSAHVAWGEAVRAGKASRAGSRNGLVVNLKDPVPAVWEFDMRRGIATRSVRRTSEAELTTCARCHARRSVLTEGYAYGRPFMDTHRPALLDEALYHADGQIKEEVYEYGSFLQSRMHRAGVTCSDCHDPHSLKVRVSPDATCARCHLPEKFATPGHHFHRQDSKGASCVECHMPAQKYMVVDPRRDHSLRVPRPDLSLRIGTPNACNRCHADRGPEWAAAAATKWWPGLAARPQFAEAIHAGRNALPGAAHLLTQVADDAAQPPIARATAVSLMGRYAGAGSMGALGRWLRDGEPMVRAAAVPAVATAEPSARSRMLGPLLSDPVRAVRIDAARGLATTPRETLTPEEAAALDAGLGEYRDEQRANGDRAESHANLCGLEADLGRFEEAEGACRKAIALNPRFPPAYVSLAELERRRGLEQEGEQALRQGLAVCPLDPDLHHALGLLLARVKRMPEAVESLRRAAELAPGGERYAYVYAVALHSTGHVDRALAVLKKAHELHAGDSEILVALATFSRGEGRMAEAADYARKLVALAPEDAAARALLAQLEAGQR